MNVICAQRALLLYNFVMLWRLQFIERSVAFFVVDANVFYRLFCHKTIYNIKFCLEYLFYYIHINLVSLDLCPSICITISLPLCFSFIYFLVSIRTVESWHFGGQCIILWLEVYSKIPYIKMHTYTTLLVLITYVWFSSYYPKWEMFPIMHFYRL